MKCAACQYAPDTYAVRREWDEFIELESMQESVGPAGDRRLKVGMPKLHTVFACPRCGTLRIEVAGGG